MQKSNELVAKHVDSSLLAEALSAWMDGQDLPPGISQEELVQWLLDDPEAQQKWRLWHAGADCLQLAQLHEERAPGHSVVGSPAWIAHLQHRLSDAAVMDSPDSVSAPLSAQANPVVTISRPAAAANDPVWRWKMAAGFASLIAVGLVSWNLMGQSSAPTVNRSLVAVRSSAAGASVAAEGSSSSQRMQEIPAWQTVDTVATSDTYTEALILAHAQLGEPVLLQDALPLNEGDPF